MSDYGLSVFHDGKSLNLSHASPLTFIDIIEMKKKNEVLGQKWNFYKANSASVDYSDRCPPGSQLLCLCERQFWLIKTPSLWPIQFYIDIQDRTDYVAPRAGYYLFAAHIRFPNPPSAASVYLKIDSSTSPTKAAVIGQTSKDYWPMDMIFELSCVVYLNKNQSVSLYVYQNTGSTMKNNQHSDLSIFRISKK